MSDYIIKTFDDKEYTIDSETALELIEAWKGSDRAFPVDLGTEAINSSTIKTIEPKKYTEADLPRIEAEYQIEAGNRCRGQFSIQAEINRLAMKQPKWAKCIKSKKWRQETRNRLLAQKDKLWCDYKISECNCEESFISYKRRYDTRRVAS